MNKFVKILALTATMISTSQTFANDLIKTYDGSIATCSSKADQEKHSIGAVYRPLKLEQNGKTAKITIEFLKCTSNKGQFAFSRDLSIEKRKSNVTDYSTRDLSKLDVSIERSNTSILAFTGAGELIDRQNLKRNSDGTFSATIKTDAVKYDNSPTGKKSFEIAVQSEFVLTDMATGESIDRGIENLGSYRLIVK